MSMVPSRGRKKLFGLFYSSVCTNTLTPLILVVGLRGTSTNAEKPQLCDPLHSASGHKVDCAEIPLELVGVRTLIYPLR
jgi:hypothetical protein